MFASGDVLGKYEIVREIGRGGMGAVYEALDRTLGRCVALKVLRSELTASREMLERFLAEARAAAAVSHPNVVTLYEVGEFEGTHFIAMELLSDDLGRLIHRSGAMAIDDVRRLGFEIAAGLGAAHRAGLIHRDVKPSNVMLTADGTAKLVDFGIARLGEGVGLTRTGLAMGTPTYMSPEQGTGAAVDHRTDLYSLGIMLFEMLTGRVPYDASTAVGVLYQHAHAPLPDVRSVRPDAPAWLAEVIGRCLAKSPEGRFADADQVARALQTGAAPMAPAPPATMPIAPQPAPRTAQGRGWLLPALVMAVVGCIVVAGLLAAQVASSFRPTAPRPAVGGTPAWGTAYEGTPSASPGTRGAQDLDVPAEPEGIDEPESSEPEAAEEAQTGASGSSAEPGAEPGNGSGTEQDGTGKDAHSTGPVGLYPWTQDRKVEPKDLEGLTNWQCTVMRDEIYARHGRKWHKPRIREYFESQEWYEEDPEYSDSRLSEMERGNAEFIRLYQLGEWGHTAISPPE